MRDLHFLNFNNYFNRTIKRLETIADYDEYLAADYVRRINFVPNDGINTEVIINCASMNIYDNMPDYVIVIDTTSNDIESRWFIIASTRTTNNQWRFTLKRDSISDNYSNVLAATCMIYRGMLRDNDVAIYNTEGTSFNKIKKWELPLKDYTGIPWIVAYISPDVAKNSKWTDEEGKEHTGPATITADIEGYYTEEYDSLEDYPYYQYIGHKYVHNQQTNILVPYQSGSNAIPTNMIHFFLMSLNRERSIAIEDMVKPDKFWDDLKIYYLSRYSELLNFPAPIISYLKDTLQERYSKLSDTILKKLNDYTDSNTTIYWSDDTATDTLVRNLQKEDGKVIKVGNKYYKVNFTFNLNQMVCDSIAIGSNIDKEIQKCLYDLPFVSYPSIDKQYTEQVYKEEMIKVFGNLYTFTISSEWDADISLTYNFSGKNVSNNERLMVFYVCHTLIISMLKVLVGIIP